jgi:hypothetical protein
MSRKIRRRISRSCNIMWLTLCKQITDIYAENQTNRSNTQRSTVKSEGRTTVCFKASFTVQPAQWEIKKQTVVYK